MPKSKRKSSDQLRAEDRRRKQIKKSEVEKFINVEDCSEATLPSKQIKPPISNEGNKRKHSAGIESNISPKKLKIGETCEFHQPDTSSEQLDQHESSKKRNHQKKKKDPNQMMSVLLQKEISRQIEKQKDFNTSYEIKKQSQKTLQRLNRTIEQIQADMLKDKLRKSKEREKKTQIQIVYENEQAKKRMREKRSKRTQKEVENEKEIDKSRKFTSRIKRTEEKIQNDKQTDKTRKYTRRKNRTEEEIQNDKQIDKSRKSTRRINRPEEEIQIDKQTDKTRKSTRRINRTEEEIQNDKQIDKSRKSTRRINRLEEEIQNDKQTDKTRKSTRRINRTEEEIQNDKQIDKTTKSTRRINRTQEEIQNDKQTDKTRKSTRRINRTEEEIQNDKQIDKSRKSTRRINRPEEEIQNDKQTDKSRKSTRRINRTEKEIQNDKQIDKTRKSTRRINRTEEEIQNDKQIDKSRKSTRRINRPEEEIQNDKQTDKSRKSTRRINRTEKEIQNDKQIDKTRKSTRRKNRTEEEIQNDKRIDKSRKLTERCDSERQYCQFTEGIKMGPEFPCLICARMLYKQSVQKLDNTKIKRLDQEIWQICVPDWNSSCDDKCTFICATCFNAMLKKKIPAQATVNGMNVAELEEPLKSLSDFEARLISQRLIFMKIVALPKGNQKAIFGSVVNVPVDATSTTNLLPRLPSNAGLIPVKLKRKLDYRGHVQFEYISPTKIISALHYLHSVNTFYKDVQIMEQWTEAAAADDNDLWQSLTQTTSDTLEDYLDNNIEIEKGGDQNNEDESDSSDHEDDSALDSETNKLRSVTFDTCLQNSDFNGNQILSIAPGEGKIPKSLLTDENNEVLSFPKLFPDGLYGIDHKRTTDISISRYFNARLLHKDGRFASNIDYIFYAQHLRDLLHINSSINIAMRKAKSSKLTAGQIKDASQMRSFIQKDHAYKFLSQIRGSPAYFDKILLELLAAVKQLGPFTWFLTLSAADLQWHETIQVIAKQQGVNLSDEDVDQLSYTDRCDWIRKNPLTAARHFDYRLQLFIKHILLNSEEPVGPVGMYMYRIEFQQRGSPHAHMAIWIKGAPTLENSSDEDLIQFHDKYVSTNIPDNNEDLKGLVNKLQRHSHSASCRKSSKSCRFGYPRPPVNNTLIIRKDTTNVDNQPDMLPALVKKILSKVYEVLDDNKENDTLEDILKTAGITEEQYLTALKCSRKTNAIIVKRAPLNKNINNYNPTILSLWKANMDIQFVCDAYACIMYICSYITKAERTLGDLLRNVSKECANIDVQNRLKTVSSKFLSHREVSAQEACYRVLSLPLSRFSRKRIFIPTNLPSERVQLLKPMSQINNMDDDDEDIYLIGLLGKYQNRPSPLENMCLAEFAATYDDKKSVKSSEDSTPDILEEENTVETLKYIILRNGNYMRMRKQPAIIRTHRFSKQKDPERYAYSMLLLYFPWRDEEKDLGQDKFVEKLKVVSDVVNKNMEPFEKNANLIDSIVEEIEENGPLDNEDAWNLVASEQAQENMDAVSEGRTVDVDEHFIDPDFLISSSNTDPSLSSTATVRYELQSSLMTDSEWKEHVRSLNAEQENIHSYIVSWCTKTVQSRKSSSKPDPLYIFITGGAGTGKSHLIKAIYQTVYRLLHPIVESPDDITIALAAPTGTAAFNIDGTTLHASFLLPVMKSLTRIPPLTPDKLNTLRTRLQNLTILVLDEVSMVSADMLLMIDSRLKQIKGCDKIFGGVSILAFGDLFQLPPVAQTSIFALPSDPMARLYGSIWQQHFQIFELNQIMRQADDIHFAQLLNRIRIGIHTEDDVLTLKSRISQNPPINALYVFTTNAAVDNHNIEKLQSLSAPVITIESKDSKKDTTTGTISVQLPEKHTQTGGLRKTLQLAVGARVMLTYNVKTDDGLVNGAKGTVTGFLPNCEFTQNYTPKFVLVKFDNCTVGLKCRQAHKSILPKDQYDSVPIPAIDILLQLGKHSKVHATRHQFPLTLAWATTIHKVQGETLNEIVISCDGRFQPGQLYVAISRVKSLHGLHFINFSDAKITTSKATIEEVERMKKTMLFDYSPSLKTLPDLRQNTAISHINAQSLNCHQQEVSHHYITRCSHVLCITETFLMPFDSNNKLYRKGYKILRKDRSQALPNQSIVSNRRQYAAHGGTLIYIHEDLHSEEIKLIDIEIEAIAVLVQNRLTNKRFSIVNIYRPPDYDILIFLQHMDSVMNCIPHMNVPTIVIGDFNVNFIEKSSADSHLSKFMCYYGFHQLITQPTHRFGSLLDHLYINFHLPEDIIPVVTPVHFSQHSFISCVFPSLFM